PPVDGAAEPCQLVLQVDDLVQPSLEQIRLPRLSSLAWPHAPLPAPMHARVESCFAPIGEEPTPNLQGNRRHASLSRQIQCRRSDQSTRQISTLVILHGRLTRVGSSLTLDPTYTYLTQPTLETRPCFPPARRFLPT